MRRPRDTTLTQLTAATSLDTPLDELAEHETALHVAAAHLLGYSQSARIAQAAVLRQWGHWLATHNHEPLAVEPATVEAFLQELEHRSPKTVKRAGAALRTFYEYAYRQDLIATNPVPGGKPANRAAKPLADVKRASDNAIRRRLEELAREAEELQAELDSRTSQSEAGFQNVENLQDGAS